MATAVVLRVAGNIATASAERYIFKHQPRQLVPRTGEDASQGRPADAHQRRRVMVVEPVAVAEPQCLQLVELQFDQR
jgi:hypothetical protein